MKIRTEVLDYESVLKLPQPRRRKPKKPSLFFRTLMKTVGIKDLKNARFSYREIGMEQLGKKEPALFLMNHSSFIDLEIATNVLYPRPLNIVCTSDGFVGKDWLMRNLGCIPTQKFITDAALVRDLIYTVKKLNSSVLMYPEASYTFDGTATPLPEGFAKCVKLLSVPVVMIRTEGAFLHDPLYNMLQKRDVSVSAAFTYLLSPEKIKTLSVSEIAEIINKQFEFDGFRQQQEQHISVKESFRADGLNRVLYRCPRCQTEGEMRGSGTKLTCGHCGKSWELTEYGFLSAEDGKDDFTHVPDWYRWERECVRRELADGTYRLDLPVDIRVMKDRKAIYEIGEGRLIHDVDGFRLTGADGKLDYRHKPSASYSLYADYYWYELGDVICIGTNEMLYYCFPKVGGDVVAKARLATEELYKMQKKKPALQTK